MILAVFRSRVRPEAVSEYRALAEQLSEIAKGMPGYIAHKGFLAADGEQVTLNEFDTAENLRKWSKHPEHVKAKVLGRKAFYESYRVQLCTVERDDAFSIGRTIGAEVGNGSTASNA
jgi:heme-degrading monooxygenase HmoA